MERTKYYYSLKSKIRTIIYNELTIGRRVHGLKSYEDRDINDFIKFNDSNIEKAISTMLDIHRQNNELELLENPEFDLVAKYLYDFVRYDKLC